MGWTRGVRATGGWGDGRVLQTEDDAREPRNEPAHIARMAQDYLAIPATSVSVE